MSNWKTFLEKSRGQISSIEGGTEVATAITSIASQAITGAIAVAQASETTEAVAKATVVVAVVEAHWVRAWGFGWVLKVTFLRMNITSYTRTFILPPCGCGKPQYTSVILFENLCSVKNKTIKPYLSLWRIIPEMHKYVFPLNWMLILQKQEWVNHYFHVFKACVFTYFYTLHHNDQGP